MNLRQMGCGRISSFKGLTTRSRHQGTAVAINASSRAMDATSCPTGHHPTIPQYAEAFRQRRGLGGRLLSTEPLHDHSTSLAERRPSTSSHVFKAYGATDPAFGASSCFRWDSSARPAFFICGDSWMAASLLRGCQQRHPTGANEQMIQRLGRLGERPDCEPLLVNDTAAAAATRPDRGRNRLRSGTSRGGQPRILVPAVPMPRD